jgi:hypothetical protein
LNDASAAPVKCAQLIADCGLRIADFGNRERRVVREVGIKNEPEEKRGQSTTNERPDARSIRNPQSAIRNPRFCSSLIHLFREKTGSQFSARSLE